MPTNNTRYSVNGEDSPILLGVHDWNAEWMLLQEMRRKADDKVYWNKRAKDFDDPDRLSPYTQEFLRRANIPSGSTVLDMGCGTGSIAIPLARQGCKVIAADFSEEMLSETQRRVEVSNTENVETLCMSWEDNWEDFGLSANSVDVVIASRSLAVRDLAQALDKMSSTASEMCCATMTSGNSPRMDARILAVCGLEQRYGKDYQYAFNILANKGYMPSCTWILSERKDTFDSAEEAYADFKRMIDDVADTYPPQAIDEAVDLLHVWISNNLIANEDAGKPDGKGYEQKSLTLREPRIIPWAFLSWRV